MIAFWFGLAALALIALVEWLSARPAPVPVHSLDCRDNVRDINCPHISHHTREDVEFIQSLDSQIGFKP